VQGVGGLKTGFTEAAGENLVSLYKKDGHDLLIVILKSQDRFADTKTVIKWIDDNVRYYFVK
jgi:D-alanyl-D-alanine carboxypeptidase